MADALNLIDLDARSGIATGGRRPQYLLFAGDHEPPRGGLGDLVAVFTSDQAARSAFRAVRLRTSSGGGWAQLAMVDGDEGVRPLCWFGIGAEARRHKILDPQSVEMDAAPRPAHVDPRRTAVLLTALVAVIVIAAALVDDTRNGHAVNPRPTATTLVPAGLSSGTRDGTPSSVMNSKTGQAPSSSADSWRQVHGDAPRT